MGPLDSKSRQYSLDTYQLCQKAQGPYTSNLTCGCEDTGPSVEEIGLKLSSPTQISWTVSRKCNFSCPHCFNNSSADNKDYEPPRELIVDNICDASPFNVCLCGGEPLAWPDLGDITKRLRGGGIMMVSLVTNGYLATYDRLKKAADDGLNTIQVSVDGSNPDEHKWSRPSEGSWERAKRAVIDSVKIEGIKSVAVSWIPNRHNIESFYEVAQMVAEWGATDLRVQPLMSSGRASEVFDDYQPTGLQYATLQMQIVNFNNEIVNANGGRQFVTWGDPLEHIWMYSATPAIPQQLSIQSNGWFELSPYMPILLGDSTKHSIREFWDKNLREMWRIPLVLEYAEKLAILGGMRELTPRPYFEEPVMIDRFDDENWKLAQETADPYILIEYARKKGLYDCGRKDM